MNKKASRLFSLGDDSNLNSESATYFLSTGQPILCIIMKHLTYLGISSPYYYSLPVTLPDNVWQNSEDGINHYRPTMNLLALRPAKGKAGTIPIRDLLLAFPH